MGPVASLLFAAAFWGVVWYPLRLLESAGLSGAWQLVASYGAAFAVLMAVARPGRPDLSRHGGRLLLLALAAGWTNLGFVLAMLEGTVARVLILFYLSPLWTVLLGRLFLGERLAPATLAALAMGLVGALLMLWRPEAAAGGVEWADLLALTSGLAFAVSNVTTRSLAELDVRLKTLASWAGVILLSLLAALQEPPPAAPAAAWGGAVVLGVAGFLAATLAVIHGVSRMPVQRSAVILLVEIPVGALSAWWLAGEHLSLREWVGGGMIVAAGLLAIRAGRAAATAEGRAE